MDDGSSDGNMNDKQQQNTMISNILDGKIMGVKSIYIICICLVLLMGCFCMMSMMGSMSMRSGMGGMGGYGGYGGGYGYY